MKLWLAVTILGLLALPITACSSAPESTLTPPTSTEPEGPVLSTALKRGCPPTAAGGNFDNAGLGIGETAVNFTLRDSSGTEFRLSGLLAEKPVLMVFGSFT